MEEKLKQLLEDGTITQEMFDSIVNGGADENKSGNSDNGFSQEDFQKEVQSQVDKLTAKFGKEKAELKKQLDELKKANMTAEEKRNFEVAEKEKELEVKARELTDKENRFYAMRAIKNAGLDDGSEEALNIIDFVLGDSEDVINEKVKNFKALIDKMILNATEMKFKENGRTPSGYTNKKASNNPWAKDSINLTEQMKIEMGNPELAASLKREAGLF